MWNFKGWLWNSPQTILLIHWNITFLSNVKILRALRFKSSYALFECPQDPLSSFPSYLCPPYVLYFPAWNTDSPGREGGIDIHGIRFIPQCLELDYYTKDEYKKQIKFILPKQIQHVKVSWFSSLRKSWTDCIQNHYLNLYSQSEEFSFIWTNWHAENIMGWSLGTYLVSY